MLQSAGKDFGIKTCCEVAAPGPCPRVQPGFSQPYWHCQECSHSPVGSVIWGLCLKTIYTLI